MPLRRRKANDDRVIADRGADALIRSLRDRRSHVRSTAAEALGHLGDQRAVEPLIGALREYVESYRVIKERTSRAGTGGWIKESEYDRIREKHLAGVGEEAVRALGRLGSIPAMDCLLDYRFGEDDLALRARTWLGGEEISKTLLEFPADELVPRLIDILRTQRGGAVGAMAAADLLGRIHDPRAFESLVGAIDTARGTAIWAIARYRGNRPLPVLISAMGNEHVREDAFEELLPILVGRGNSLSADEARELERLESVRTKPPWSAGLMKLAKFVPQNADSLLDALSRGSPRVRWLAAQLFGAARMSSNLVVDGLSARLRIDEDDRVVLEAARALSDTGSLRAIEALKDCAVDPGEPPSPGWWAPDRLTWRRKRRALAMNALKKLSPETYEQLKPTLQESGDRPHLP